MKLLLVVLSVVAAVSAEFYSEGNEPFEVNYHENYGIPEAARIKALEESLDFDGNRIAGGSNARVGQYPFMGGLLINTPRGTSVCGSSLISNTRLVTAAHCWNDGNTQARELTVVLGSVTLFSGGHRTNTNRVRMHPNWNHRTIANDVAMITINHVGFSNNINRINVATGNNQFVGVTANAVGFGLKGDNTNIAPNQPLSHVSLQIIANDACRRSFSNVQASNICTSGANGRSPCRGDSGGPLAQGNNLLGIVSFGSILGCTRGFPAVFARVTFFASWINSN